MTCTPFLNGIGAGFLIPTFVLNLVLNFVDKVQGKDQRRSSGQGSACGSSAVSACSPSCFPWRWQPPRAPPTSTTPSESLAEGTTFTTETNQWQASTASVVVTTNAFYSAAHSVWMPRASALSNHVGVAGAAVGVDGRAGHSLSGDRPAESGHQCGQLPAFTRHQRLILNVWSGHETGRSASADV